MSILYQAEYETLSRLYGSLPARERKGLLRQAERRAEALDAAIARYIPTTVEWDQDHYLISDETVNMYGVGATVGEALAEYRSMLVEYYEGLAEHPESLSARLREHLALLRKIFEDA